jgi:hypothetical protein
VSIALASFSVHLNAAVAQSTKVPIGVAAGALHGLARQACLCAPKTISRCVASLRAPNNQIGSRACCDMLAVPVGAVQGGGLYGVQPGGRGYEGVQRRGEAAQVCPNTSWPVVHQLRSALL